MEFVLRLLVLIAQIIIGITPVFLLLYGIDLFKSNLFSIAYIFNLVLMSVNNVTDFSLEIPGVKATSKNTGASVEIDRDIKNKKYKLITHGSTDVEKVKKLVDFLEEKIK